MKLYSYCIPYDDGAAPNPYWGICTLTICKPRIRSSAKIGDWIVGTGAKKVECQCQSKDFSNKLVYAMKITDKMALSDYDLYCMEKYPKKIPDWKHRDHRRRLGDCIYDFSTNPPRQREGVHKEVNRKTDLNGKYALISNHFYYFGDNAIPVPENLQGIVKQGRGHRSDSNRDFIPTFIDWIYGLKLELNRLYGYPQLNIFDDLFCAATCSEQRAKEK